MPQIVPKEMKVKRLALVFLTALMGFSGVCFGDDPSEQWLKRLNGIEELIHEGRYRKAASKAARFEEDMLELIIDGPRVPEFLGKIAGLYSLALAGKGEIDHSVWKWQMATEFFPQISSIDLSAFGQAGRALGSGLEEAPSFPAQLYLGKQGPTEPKVLKGPDPKFPVVQREAGTRCRLTVEVLIGIDGFPRKPRVVKSDGRPTLVYTTLDALRAWRFKPSEFDGQPIQTLYILTVNFK